MLIRMCPLCDHEMKKHHYCDTCHSFIWQADMVDVHLNPESRGYSEVKALSYDQYSGSQTQKKKGDYKQYVNKSAKQKNTVKGCRSKAGALLIVILIVVRMVITVIDNIDMDFHAFEVMLEDLFSDEVIIDYSDVEEVLPETLFEQYEMSYEEVMAQGLPCSGYDHLNVDGSVIFKELYTYAENTGLTFENGNVIEESYNEVYADEYGKNTYFEIQQSFWDDEEQIYVHVSYDTYSHELHALTMDGYNKALLIDYLKQALNTMDSAGLDIGMWKETTYEDVFNTGSSGYKFTDIGDITVYTSVDEYEIGTHYVVSLDAQ